MKIFTMLRISWSKLGLLERKRCVFIHFEKSLCTSFLLLWDSNVWSSCTNAMYKSICWSSLSGSPDDGLFLHRMWQNFAQHFGVFKAIRCKGHWHCERIQLGYSLAWVHSCYYGSNKFCTVQKDMSQIISAFLSTHDVLIAPYLHILFGK